MLFTGEIDSEFVSKHEFGNEWLPSTRDPYFEFTIAKFSFTSTGRGLCPGVLVHRGNNYCTPLFTSLCLAIAYCWVYCIGSCVPVHEDRTGQRFRLNVL